MKVDLLEFARKLAEGGRAKIAEDQQRLETLLARSPSGLQTGESPATPRL